LQQIRQAIANDINLLSFACQNGNLAIVRLLLHFEPDIVLLQDKSEEIALWKALSNESIDIVEELLRYHPEVQVMSKNRHGVTQKE